MFTPLSLLTLSALLTTVFGVPTHYLTERSTPGSKKAIAALFEWNWPSVQNECSFLAQAGYGYVQVSPAQEHLTGQEWWTAYQAVSYLIQSNRGNRQQYASMVKECNAVGVQVIADVVINHMAGEDSGTGSAGHSFTHYNYPGTYAPGDFHYCGTPDDAIDDWSNEWQIETCQLVDLADLNTESETVRARLAQHLNDLLSLGVHGFRIDAAKHVAPDSVTNILSRLSKKVYITQEVVDTTGVLMNKHSNVGDVQVFGYAYSLKGTFTGSGISTLANIGNQSGLASGLANVFVTSHDTERDGSALNYKSGAAYTIAHVFLLSYPYGTPTVHSGYAFSDINQGPPNNHYGTCSANGPANGWECQHRWTTIVNMVKFFNQVGSARLTNVKTGNSQQLAYGRGSAGHVAINNSGSTWKVTLTTGLADGKYCDVVSGSKVVAKCSGATITVTNKRFTVSVPARNAIAIYSGAKL